MPWSSWDPTATLVFSTQTTMALSTRSPLVLRIRFAWWIFRFFSCICHVDLLPLPLLLSLYETVASACSPLSASSLILSLIASKVNRRIIYTLLSSHPPPPPPLCHAWSFSASCLHVFRHARCFHTYPYSADWAVLSCLFFFSFIYLFIFLVPSNSHNLPFTLRSLFIFLLSSLSIILNVPVFLSFFVFYSFSLGWG